MVEARLCLALEFRNNALGEHLAQLDAPLIEGVDMPDRPLGKNRLLVKSDEFAEDFRGEPLGEDSIRWTVALEYASRYERIRRSFSLDLLGRLAEGQCLGLREHVGHEHVMVPAEPIERLTKSDEITRDESRSLVDQLVKRMLAVGSRLSPIDGTGIVIDPLTIESHMLAVTLHRQLLEVSRKALEVLLIGQHRHGLCAEEVVIPDGQEAHEHRQIPLKWRGAEMLIHLVKAVQHRAEIIRADRNHRRKADRRVHRIAPADPVPEPEHVGCINAELRHFRRICGYRNKVLSDRLFVAP